MRRWRVKAVSPEDGVTFLDWTTDAPDSQAALRGFLLMLDDCLGPEYHLNGDWNIQVREVEEMVAVKSKWPRAVG